MRTKIIIIVTLTFIAGTVIIGCDSSGKKVADAQGNVQTSFGNVEKAKNDFSQVIKDSTNNYQKFKKESEERIGKYEKEIAELKVKIANEKKDGISDYEKIISDLEQKTIIMKKDLKEYREDGKADWKSFKTNFNNNMDNLGIAISNLFSNKKKN
jgi:F0F1-type ATP synthase membrane subunit b/b'